MRKFLMIGLLIGLGVIVVLGGYMIFCLEKFKSQAEIAINQGLEQYNDSLKKIGIRLGFAPFECKGVLSVKCKSTRVEVFQEKMPQGEKLLAIFSNPILAFKDFDFKGLTLEYTSGFDYVQEGDLKNYFEVLMPKVLRFASHLRVQSQEGILAQNKLHFEAQNLVYDVDFDSRMLATSFKGKEFFAYLMSLGLEGESIFLENVKLQLQANELNQALFEVAKKQYGNLDYAGYQGIVALMAGLSMSQFSAYSVIQKIIVSFKQLMLGEKNKVVVRLEPKQRICLTCEGFESERFLQDSDVKIEAF